MSHDLNPVDVAIDAIMAGPDSRLRSLVASGAWSDLEQVPCERCGTALTIVDWVDESDIARLRHVMELDDAQRAMRLAGALGSGLRQWAELHKPGSQRFLATTRNHDPQRCRSMRDRRPP